jgi:hypothetical protein
VSDEEIKIVSAKYPEMFESAVNELLRQGDWRVVATEMSVTDHHYFAMLVKGRERG